MYRNGETRRVISWLFGEQRIDLPLPQEVGGYGRILRRLWNRGEGLGAADGLAGREIGKCSLARER